MAEKAERGTRNEGAGMNEGKWCLVVAGINIGLALAGLVSSGTQTVAIINAAMAVLLIWASLRLEEL